MFGEDVAKKIDACGKNCMLYADCCWAETFLKETKKALKNKNLIQVALGSCKQKALFFQDKDLKGYYAFTGYFLENYYLIITDPNVMEGIEKEAKAKNLPIMVVIMHEAFEPAKNKTQQLLRLRGGKVVPVETVTPTIDQSKIKLPNKPIIKVKTIEKIGGTGGRKYRFYEYRFHFYKVIDAKTKKCVVVGYVKKIEELPIAPIESVSSEEDCSITEFKFKVDDKEHGVKIEKKGEIYTVTIDGKAEKKRFEYTRINFKNYKRFGSIGIYVKPGKNPEVLVKGKPKKAKYDQKKGILTFEVKKHNIKIEFKPFGAKKIQVGKEEAYPDHLAMRHSMYNSDGLRVGELAMVSYDGYLEGELWLEDGDHSFPLSGKYDEETGLFVASAETDRGLYSFSHLIEEGIPITKWWLEGSPEAGYLQASYFEPPIVTTVDATISGGGGSYSVTLHWESELELMTAEEEYLFSGYRILRYDEYGHNPEIFDVPSGQQYFVDDQVNFPINYIYHVSSKLDNRMESECIELSKYPHYSYPAIIVIVDCFSISEFLMILISAGIILGLIYIYRRKRQDKEGG